MLSIETEDSQSWNDSDELNSFKDIQTQDELDNHLNELKSLIADYFEAKERIENPLPK